MSSDRRPTMLFMAAADNRIGFGHLNRCLSAATLAETMGVAPRFAIFGDERAGERVSHAKLPFQMFPVTDLAREFLSEPVDAAVVDVIYPGYFRDGNSPKNLFGQLRKTARVVAAIDSLGEDTIAENARDAPLDFLVVPYALADVDEERLSAVGCNVLAGSNYALLSSNYMNLAPRGVSSNPCRVLVTCGGSDPLGWTPVVISALENITDRLTVRVVLGPLFPPNLRAMVAELAAASTHRVDLIDAPGNLASHMQWCDVAIAASGLTKYELAATGTPAILFSIDASHEEHNRAFAALRVAEDLGVSPSKEAIADATRCLLADRDRREAMSISAQSAVDGRGTQRIIAKILERITC
jgi:spore coat polysaccharide biosynthesis predicted glycosyltransferase SpsG